MVWIYHSLFSHSSIRKHVVCFQSSAIANKVNDKSYEHLSTGFSVFFLFFKK